MSGTDTTTDEPTAEAIEAVPESADTAAEAHRAFLLEAAGAVVAANSAAHDKRSLIAALHRGATLAQPRRSFYGTGLPANRHGQPRPSPLPTAMSEAWEQYAAEQRAKPRPQPQQFQSRWPTSITAAALATVHSLLTPQDRIERAFAGSTPTQPLFVEFSELRNACLDRTWHPNVIPLTLWQMRDAGALVEVARHPMGHRSGASPTSAISGNRFSTRLPKHSIPIR